MTGEMLLTEIVSVNSQILFLKSITYWLLFINGLSLLLMVIGYYLPGRDKATFYKRVNFIFSITLMVFLIVQVIIMCKMNQLDALIIDYQALYGSLPRGMI